METSYDELTATLAFDVNWNMLLINTHISPINSYALLKMKPRRLQSPSTSRNGTYSISQRIQSRGYKTDVAAVHQVIEGGKYVTNGSRVSLY